MLPRGQSNQVKGKPKQSSRPIPGPAGVDGTSGTQIVSGNGAPDDNMGNNGDFYINRINGNIYGPKQDIGSGGWGGPIP